MSSIANVVPSEADLLCEGCGYTLNGLPRSGNCPECGKPIEQSVGEHRRLTPWESSNRQIAAFFKTTAMVICIPRRFFSSIVTRNTNADDTVFAVIHWVFASLLFVATALLHLRNLSIGPALGDFNPLIAVPVLGVITVAALALLTRIATRLTNWEATYRGYRLPKRVVQRGMNYHAAHYLPVALLGLAIVLVYRILLLQNVVDHGQDMNYLYVLCGGVIVAAGYLFNTYWIAMRAMMWANR